MMSGPGSCGLIWAFLLLCTVQVESNSISPQGPDCTQIKILNPRASSGVYLIQPPGVTRPFKVYCEMRSDGGWTVIQKRSGAAVSFDRKWNDYKLGFGSLTDDHWLGLSQVFSLTNAGSKRWTLRVDLWDHEGRNAFASYKDFKLGNERSAFRLQVGQFSGNAGDAIRGAYPGIDQNGYGFSTSDRDNDGCNPCIFGDIAMRKCTESESGGWWYSRCGSANLNGDWHASGNHIGWGSGVHWRTWKGPAPYSAKASMMMIKSE